MFYKPSDYNLVRADLKSAYIPPVSAASYIRTLRPSVGGDVSESGGIRLEFAQFGHFTSFDVIRSMVSMASVADADLPAPIATGLKTMYYVDSDIVRGLTYYYRVRVWRGSESFVSSEIACLAGVLWTPGNLTISAKVWLEADDADVVNGRVENVLNKGSLAGFAAKHVDTTRPYYLANDLNGRGVLRFDSSALVLQNARALFKNVGYAVSFYVVKKRVEDSSALVRQIFFAQSGVGNARYADGYYLTPNSRGIGRRRLDNVGNTTLAGGVAQVGKWEIITSITRWAEAKADIRVNGVGVAQSNAFLSAGNTSDTNSNTDPSFGAEISGSSIASAGDIDLACAVVTSGVAMSESDIQKLEGWAAHKYGLAANLPDTHPYKDEPPLTDD